MNLGGQMSLLLGCPIYGLSDFNELEKWVEGQVKH